jgi:YD repeat-containing protein
MIKALLLSLFVAGATDVDKNPLPTPAPVSGSVQTSYFFTVDLDPRYQFVGTGALTEEDASVADCYRFAYNNDGKLQQIEYRRAGVPMPDPFLGVAHVDFEYKSGIERRWFRDAKGQATRNFDGVYGEELTLNAAGFPTTVTNLDDSGSKMRDSGGVYSYVRTLDNLNRLVTGRRMGLFGTAIIDKNGFFETRTVYDQQNRPIERGNYDDSGNPLNNSDGVALVRTTYTIYPDSTQIIESYFDASGLAVEEKSTGIHQRQRTIDSRGFLVDESYFDQTGAPTLTTDEGIHERRYTYDDHGNQLTEEFLDTNGKPINLKGITYAKVVYKYDAKNRVSEKAFFGDDGAPQIVLSLGAAVVRQQYDDQGNMVRRQFFDGQGHPSNHVQYGVPAIRINVDGDRTTILLRNGDDHPIKNPVSGYYAFSYKTATDKPLSPTNIFYDRHGREMSNLRIFIINPHLHLLKTAPVMLWSAYLGTGAAGLGSLLACYIALRKSSHTKRRKVFVPTAWERFLGWFSVFGIFEGSLRFFMTVYWAWIVYENGQMGPAFSIVETIFVCFFLYRLYRLTVTMRVLNIAKDDIHRLVRDFLAKANLKPEWIESKNRYVTPPLDVRINYFRQKYHAYLAFFARGSEGSSLASALNTYIRAEVVSLQAPERTKAIGLYYPSVAFCYFLLACTAFYTMAQVIKGF